MTIVLTNDDGIDSPFLRVLAETLQPEFRIRIVAPLTEQSWISKAISRRRVVEVRPCSGFSVPAWTVDGTPADCVNIALGNLFVNEPIAAVVSGINIGFNASLATVMSSGTVGAALESALMGVPSVALSKSLSHEVFETLQDDRNSMSQALQHSLISDSKRVAGWVQAAISDFRLNSSRTVVHNYNFPFQSDENTPVIETPLANNRESSIFKPVSSSDEVFRFQYREGQNIDLRTKTDLNCLSEGNISYSLIDFTRLTQL